MKVNVRPITSQEEYFAESFQYILRNLIFFENDKTRNGFEKLKHDLLKVSNLPFYKKIKKYIDQIDKKFGEIDIAKQIDLSNLSNDISHTTNALLRGNTKDFLNYAQQLQKYENAHLKNQKDDETILQGVKTKYHPWHIQNPLFFGRNGLLHQFEKEDQEKVLNINFSKPLYTYLSLPESKLHDFEFIAYWLLHLKTSNIPVELSNNEYSKYAEFAYAGKDFERLKKLLDNYLHGNQKQLIPEIIELINNNSELKAKNEIEKSKITEVYRGIAHTENMSNAQIIKQEQQNKFVATSTSLYAARNFALAKGHLEHEDNRRSEEGAIIKYKVSQNSIILDTSILGGVFHENEVLIDVSKAKIINIDRI